MPNDATTLIKTIGIPGSIEGIKPRHDEISRLLRMSESNKVQLLFARLVGNKLLNRYMERHESLLRLISLISNAIDDTEYTFVKTLRPFPRIPSDVDVILKTRTDFNKAVESLEKAGLSMIDKTPYGLTMLGSEYDFFVDLETQLSASGLIYLDSNLLFQHRKKVKIDGTRTYTLEPYMDLLAIACHSVFKEWMYTASDYYTTVLWIQHIPRAFKLANEIHARMVMDSFLKHAYAITIHAFGTECEMGKKLKRFVAGYVPGNEIHRSLPLKYDLSLVLRCWTEKVKDPMMKASVPLALRLIPNPKFIRSFVNNLIRKSY